MDFEETFCREIVLARMNDHFHCMNGRSEDFCKNPTIFINLSLIKGDYGKFEKFLHIFNSKLGDYRITYEGNDKGTLSFSYCAEKRLRHLYEISFILYLFRNGQIIDNILEKFSRRVTAKRIYEYLSHQFLNPMSIDSWVNTSNPALGMSMYCYLMAIDWDFGSDFKDGPISAAYAQNISIDKLKQYIEKVFIPSKIIPKFFQTKFDGNINISFKKRFESVYSQVMESKHG